MFLERIARGGRAVGTPESESLCASPEALAEPVLGWKGRSRRFPSHIQAAFPSPALPCKLPCDC